MRSLLLAALTLPALAFAQGDLTPPPGAFSGGAPAPSMKSLTQVEPRTPLELGSPGVSSSMNGGFIIDLPGSYYLTGNLNLSSGNAIDIGASNVTLDLNGFAILSTAGAGVVRGSGIEIASGATNITIRNGRIAADLVNGAAGCGFDNGIKCGTNVVIDVVIEDIGVSNVATNGLDLSGGGIVRRCTVSEAKGTGIIADDVFDSRTRKCSTGGIICTGLAQNCAGITTGGIGLKATVAINCMGDSYSDTGLQAIESATGCIGISQSGIGLLAAWKNTMVETGGTAENCRGFANGGGTGLFAFTATNCHGESFSGIGLHVTHAATGCTGITRSGTYGAWIRSSERTLGIPPLEFGVAQNCFGRAWGSGTGLCAEVATGCKGASNTGIGLQALQSATGCFGTTVSGNIGLWAGDTGTSGAAENCRGTVTGTGATGTGLAAETASNCFGQSTASTGLYASTASNCSAYTATGAEAMVVAGSATNCRGNNGSGGTAIRAAIAVSCTTAGGAILGNKQLGTP